MLQNYNALENKKGTRSNAKMDLHNPITIPGEAVQANSNMTQLNSRRTS